MKKEVNQLKMGAILTYITLVISTIIPMLYTPVMLNILGQAEYGLYSLSNSVTGYFNLLALGLSSAVIRYLMKYKTNGDKNMFERVAGLFIIVFSAITCLILLAGFILTFFTGTLFSNGLTKPEIEKLNILILLACFAMGFAFVSSVYAVIIICYERYVFRKLSDMVFTILAPLLNLLVLYLGGKSISMMIAGVIGQIVNTIVFVVYIKRKLGIRPQFKNPPFEILKSIFSFSAFVFIGEIAQLLYGSTDRVLIGAMIGTVGVAVYNIGGTFNGMVQNLSSAISGVFAPRVNTHVFKNSPIDQLSLLLIRVGRLQYLIVSLVVSGFIAFGQDFIILWAGTEYEQAYLVALFTMIPLVVPLIQNIAFTSIVAMNKHRFRSIVYLFIAIANAVSTYIVIPYWGIIGASACSCVSYLIGHVIIMNWYYHRKIGFDIPKFWLNILRMSIVPVALVLVYVCLKTWIIPVPTNLILLICYILVYTIAFVLLSFAFSMNHYERELFYNPIRKIWLKIRKCLLKGNKE